MSATQNVAIKLNDHYHVYDDIRFSSNSAKGSLRSALWFWSNLIWESRFRIPAVIILGIIALNLSGVHYEIISGNLGRRRRQRNRESGWGNDDSDDDDDGDDDDNDEDGDDDEDEDDGDYDDDDSDGEYESEDDDIAGNRLYFPESMFFIDPAVDPENDNELFDFIRRENPSYEHSLMRRQPLPSEFQHELTLPRCSRIDEID